MEKHQPIVLVVDDDEEDRVIVRRLLHGQFEVIQAHDEPSALAAIRDHKVYCVLLDYMIPGTNSVTLLVRIRTLGVPVVMMTGLGSERIAVTLLQHGAMDYLPKNELETRSLQRTIDYAANRVDLEDRLARRRQELDEVVQIASRDLETPLEKGIACHQALQDMAETLTPEMSDLVKEAGSTFSLVKELAADLLRYLQIDARNARKTAVELDEIITQVRTSLADQLDARHANIEYQPAPTLLGDRAEMLLLFEQLVAMGIDSGEPSTTVMITHEVISDQVAFSVQAPLSPDRNNRNLEQAICRKLVDIQNGTFQHFHAQGNLEIRFSLPLAPASLDQAPIAN